jgi:hypothetical protein
MDVCVLSSRGLCYEPIRRPELLRTRRRKAKKLNVGAHLYQPVGLDYKSSPWRAGNAIILNSLAIDLSRSGELLNFAFLGLIVDTQLQSCSRRSLPLSRQSPPFQLSFIIHLFFLRLIRFFRFLLILFVRHQHQHNCIRIQDQHQPQQQLPSRILILLRNNNIFVF